MRIWWGTSRGRPISKERGVRTKSPSRVGEDSRGVLIDVSRLIWRRWRGGLPTGVDRVCLAYVEHFRGRANAVVQRRGHHFILDAAQSDQLFALLCSGRDGFRVLFLTLAAKALLRGSQA